MPIKLARTAGFCMGVRRAMNTVLKSAYTASGPIHTLGPLVHNHQAMEMLASKGVGCVDEPEEIAGGTAFIRAHGVTPEVAARLAREGVEVCDLTCPHVVRAQRIIAKHAAEGCFTVIIGDPGHAEVVGLLGHAGGRGKVLSTPAEVADLPVGERLCVVAQTTQDSERFAELVPLIQERFPDASIHNTVCSATDDRQSEVRELAGEVDALIVVGGRHSANTVRLAAIAREEGVPTFLIETAAELDPEALAPHHTVGITAGASTPHWVFREVEERARQCQLRARSPLLALARRLLVFCIHAYLYIGLGTAGTTFAALHLLGLSCPVTCLGLAASYVVVMHIFHRFRDPAACRLNDPLRTAMFERHRVWFRVAMVALPLVTLALAVDLGLRSFLLTLLALAAGFGYHLRLMPPWLERRIGFKAAREVPGSKSVAAAGAWATMGVLVPALAGPLPRWGDLCGLFGFVFLMVLIRSIVYDLKDLEGDRIMGRETLPLALGAKGAVRLVFAGTALLALIVLIGLLNTNNLGVVLVLLPVLLAILTYLWLYKLRVIAQGLVFELVVDLPFLLMGLGALLLSLLRTGP